ncbi:MAG TPA: hypothetical protein VJ826_07465 [Candidatus Polarisedimenticolaceae bacterium]|nr:hypothetical protein [Candidatus Polarisedimenticolaceae bacterium]
MRKLGLLAVFVLVLAASWFTFAAPGGGGVPKGWFMAGSDPTDYIAALDQGRGAFIASKDGSPRGFGTMMQTFGADTYRGKRVRMTADVRAEDIEGWAGLWMRVDGSGSSSLSFDNMQNRPIKGTSGWQKYEIVLDVPEGSTNIAFGILLAGKGTAHVDDFGFEVVPITVPVTSPGKPSAATGPVNLKFDD